MTKCSTICNMRRIKKTERQSPLTRRRVCPSSSCSKGKKKMTQEGREKIYFATYILFRWQMLQTWYNPGVTSRITRETNRRRQAGISKRYINEILLFLSPLLFFFFTVALIETRLSLFPSLFITSSPWLDHHFLRQKLFAKADHEFQVHSQLFKVKKENKSLSCFIKETGRGMTSLWNQNQQHPRKKYIQEREKWYHVTRENEMKT